MGEELVAVITGAGTGIGRATALRLGRQGWRCALIGRRAAPLEEVAGGIRAAGGEASVYVLDVTDAAGVEAMSHQVLDHWRRVDLLVNNAGLNVPRRDLGLIAAADWQSVVAANLHGPFLMTRAVLPAMRSRGAGTIINVSSMAGVRASTLSGPAYSAAKAGLNSLTESINLAERANGIRACAICPGEVDTPIMEKRTWVPSEEARVTMLQSEDVADVIVTVALLPARAAVELVLMRPTILRDLSEDQRRGVRGQA